jgi:hypothetical protein
MGPANGGAKLRGGLARDAPLTATDSAQPPRTNRGDSRVSCRVGAAVSRRPPPHGSGREQFAHPVRQ